MFDGILRIMNRQEIASIIAHEISHVLMRHPHEKFASLLTANVMDGTLGLFGLKRDIGYEFNYIDYIDAKRYCDSHFLI